MDPELRKLSEDLKDRVTVAKVDARSQNPIMSLYNIRSTPSLRLFNNGKEYDHLREDLVRC